MEQQSNIPDEVNTLIERMQFLEHGSKNLETLTDFDFKTAVYKIKFLATQQVFKTSIIEFLKSSFLPAVGFADQYFDQMIAGITQKAKYGPPDTNTWRGGGVYQQGFSHFGDSLLNTNVFKGYESVTEEDIMSAKDRFREELDFYSEHFNPMIEELPLANVSHEKIKTNLNVEQIAIFFKILNGYDEPKNPQKKVIAEHTVTKLCSTVAQSFSSKGKGDINPGTLENRYHDSAQLAAAEYWVEKFKSLQIAAANLVKELIAKEDKPRARKRN